MGNGTRTKIRQPLAMQKLVEQAVNVLRDRVLGGEYSAERSFPSQGQLCEDLGVSRTVVREAMRSLQSEGLIEVSQGRRPTVLPANATPVIQSLETLVGRTNISLMQLTEVRHPLEIEIAGLAAERRSEVHIQQMREANELLQAAQTFKDQVAADMQFHKVLAEASGNSLFSLFLEVLGELLRASRRQTLKQSGVEKALRFHRGIFKAVEAGDRAGARGIMDEHMAETRVDIEDFAASKK
jgi:GntR family transcriptional repressor for pyruvate dehydrogenase complex